MKVKVCEEVGSEVKRSHNSEGHETSRHGWRFVSVCVGLAEKRLEPARIVSGLRVGVKRSRLDLLRDDVEDDVLIASPHHSPKCFVPLDGGAHVTGSGDWLAVNADDDVTLPEAGSVATEIGENLL